MTHSMAQGLRGVEARRRTTQRRQDDRLLAGDGFPVSFSRRVLDVALSLAGLVVAVPVLAAAAFLILLTDGRPVLFAQQRLGEGGHEFTMYKLRSMRTGSPTGPGVTMSGDPRVTSIGKVLRALSIDELPQLWHVLRGQMTLVGPRPESVALAERYPAFCQFVLQTRPGLTGPSQLTYREASTAAPVWADPEAWYLTVLVPLRTRADLDFLLRPNLAQTLRWLAATVLQCFGKGRDAITAADVPVAISAHLAGSALMAGDPPDLLPASTTTTDSETPS